MIKNTRNVYLHRLKFLQSARRCGPHRVLLGLGANISGTWGRPQQTLARALAELSQLGLEPLARSRLVRSRPVGGGRQPDFLNAVVMIEARLPPAALLRRLKQLERAAGRRPGRRWGPRPLDLDILDYAGRRLGWPGGQGSRLTLPHPDMHRRAFVLAPLIEVAPHWHHPVFGATAQALLRRLGCQGRHAFAAKPLISWPTHATNASE